MSTDVARRATRSSPLSSLGRRSFGVVLSLVLVAGLAGGAVVTQVRQPDSRYVIASIPVVPGAIEQLDVADLTFGVAARHSRTDRDLFLLVSPARRRWWLA